MNFREALSATSVRVLIFIIGISVCFVIAHYLDGRPFPIEKMQELQGCVRKTAQAKIDKGAVLTRGDVAAAESKCKASNANASK